MAEKVGFEPTDPVTEVNALAGRPIRPLWHFSARESTGGAPGKPNGHGPRATVDAIGAVTSLTDGTVAEWTIAPALKADESKGSAGSNPARSASVLRPPFDRVDRAIPTMGRSGRVEPCRARSY